MIKQAHNIGQPLINVDSTWWRWISVDLMPARRCEKIVRETEVITLVLHYQWPVLHLYNVYFLQSAGAEWIVLPYDIGTMSYTLGPLRRPGPTYKRRLVWAFVARPGHQSGSSVCFQRLSGTKAATYHGYYVVMTVMRLWFSVVFRNRICQLLFTKLMKCLFLILIQ